MSLHRTSGKRGLGLGLAAITMLVWGVLPLILRTLLDVMDPATITWYRFVTATLVLAAVLWRRGALPDLGRVRAGARWLLAIAVLGLAGNYLAFLEGLERTSPATTQVLIQLAPLLLALGGVFIFRERFTPLQWLGFVLLLAGLGTFFAGQVTALTAELARFKLGVGIIVAAAVSWAAYALAQKQLLVTLSSQGLMLCIYAGCALCFTPFARPAAVDALDLDRGIALGLAALATVVAYGCFSAALEHVEASRVSAVIALVPLFTLLFSALGHTLAPGHVPPEALSSTSVTGALMVVSGSVVTALGGAET
jgi:drug/metabolite transporter (DMT)-like permease